MMRKFSSVSLLLLLALAGWGPAEAPGSEPAVCTEPAALNPLRVGYAAVDITPRLEPWEDRNKNGQYDKGEKYEDRDGDKKWTRVWMAGFQPGRYATGVHDPLMARALAMQTGNVTYMVISLDLVGLLYVRVRKMRDAIQQKTGVPAGHIIIACTHTHSGPDTIGLWGGLPGLSGLNEE